MIIAGIDEAGYGPLLGPLVVSATAFELPGAVLPAEVEGVPCLWKLLKGAVVKKGAATKGRLLIADSKVVHGLTDGDRHLERGVLAFLRGSSADNSGPMTALRLMEALGCTNHGLQEHPWYAWRDCGVPLWCEAGDLGIATNMLRGAMTRAQVQVAGMRTAVLSERLFNQLVGGTNNKGAALVSVTMTHLYWLYQHFGSQGLVVGVDKQGGRDRYTDLLLRSFPETQLKVLLEGEGGSSYLVQEGARGQGAEGSGGGGRQMIVHFREKAETKFLPTALASMICKYLREMCMATFNAWWCTRVEGLKPTAGYYQDGMRWLGEVEPHLARLGVRREELLRCR